MKAAVDPIGNATVSTVSVSASSTSTAATPAAETFTEKLADQMKRIAAHAEKTETLKNGAELYLLADGKEIEQVPGKSPYIVKK